MRGIGDEGLGCEGDVRVQGEGDVRVPGVFVLGLGAFRKVSTDSQQSLLGVRVSSFSRVRVALCLQIRNSEQNDQPKDVVAKTAVEFLE